MTAGIRRPRAEPKDSKDRRCKKRIHNSQEAVSGV